MKNLNKFEENAILKQAEAYKSSFAKKQFEYSCKLCCECNLRGGKGSCDTCPIKEAHITALTEIELGKRGKPEKFNYQAQKKKNGSHVTIVIHFD